MTAKPKPSPAVGRIVRFSRHLAQAVHDVGHEDSDDIALVHFWDDDSLFLPIRGLPILLEDTRQRAEDLIAQSLFAAGFLGRVCLTTPHRNELLGQVSSWQGSSWGQAADSGKIARFKRRNAVTQVVDVANYVARTDLDEDSVNEALGRLRSLDPMSFVFVQALHGNWRSRLDDLVSIRKLIELRLIGPGTGEILERGDLFDEFAKKIEAVRPGRALATAIDAAALTAVSMMNEAAIHGQSRIYPRFFSSSTTLQGLVENDEWVARRLRYTHDLEGEEINDSVWRDSYYYFLRSLFPALRLGRGVPVERTGVEALRHLARELALAVKAGPSHALAYVNNYSVDENSNLADIIDDLEKSRMARLWLNASTSGDLGPMIESLQRLARAEEKFALADRFERAIQERFEHQFLERRLARELRTTIHEADRLIARHPGDSSISLNKDLAVVRWGLVYDGDDDRLPVFDHSTPDHRSLFEYDDIEHLSRSSDAAVRILAVLLGLERFDIASELLNRLQFMPEPVVISLMRFAVLLRSHQGLSESALKVIMDSLIRIWGDLDESDRVRYCLAFGYCAFFAWARSSQGGAYSRSDVSDANGWARWALEVVEPRMKSMTEWARVFALNHVVFVATTAELEVLDIDKYAADLETIASMTGEFRFLDTVGFRLLTEVSRRLPVHSELERDVAVGMVRRSLTYLRRAAAEEPNDSDVERHLEMALECSIALGLNEDSQ